MCSCSCFVCAPIRPGRPSGLPGRALPVIHKSGSKGGRGSPGGGHSSGVPSPPDGASGGGTGTTVVGGRVSPTPTVMGLLDDTVLTPSPPHAHRPHHQQRRPQGDGGKGAVGKVKSPPGLVSIPLAPPGRPPGW